MKISIYLMLKTISVQILKAKHENLLPQKLKTPIFGLIFGHKSIFAILTAQTHSDHF